MLANFTRVERLRVPDVGQIGAGSTVEFIPRGKVWITRPRNARPGDVLVSARVSGDSLIDDGVFDGDRVTCRSNFDLSELRDGRLVVASLPDGGLVIKHFHLTNDGRVRLASANRAHKDLYCDLDEVEIKAVVLESVRSWE